MKDLIWCQQQQAAALEHMQSGHTCSHPQCTPENNLRWLEDALMEEVMLMVEAK
jgi:hypothetical protein